MLETGIDPLSQYIEGNRNITYGTIGRNNLAGIDKEKTKLLKNQQ